ncbi:MAG: flagellar protein FlaG [Deltaproteobacteria bacterium]|nr:flagellar protein FlaG [Deltaproteobacteria bacterium]
MPAANNPPQKEPSEKAPEESRHLNSEAAKQLLEDIQSQLQSMNISLSFSTYGKNGGNIAVTVTEKDTGKVIREIPAKEIQNLYTKLGELIGIIFNHTA